MADPENSTDINASLPPAPEPQPVKASPSYTILLGPKGLRAGWSILIFIAIFVAIAFSASYVLRHLMLHFHLVAHHVHLTGEAPVLPLGLSEAVMLISVLLATAIMARIEHRPALSYGLAGTHRLRHFVVGLLTGFAFLSLLIGILVETHHMHLDVPTLAAATLWKYAVVWGCVFLMVGFFEELLLRGYLLFTLARGIYFWPAAILLAVLFGALHKGNPGESPFGLATAAGAALLFSLSLWRIGSLWWAIGFHATWDWAQSYFYGTADSGLLSRGHLMTSHASGSVWLSGGATGPEGSVWCGLILVLAALWVWFTQKRTVTPYWK
ncbi:MAG TPA: CPBP family intramembrane glutamic endopeptidase [Acidobacteriaceae bacterium]|nr:CPBP family intramembrane glutamic endopeptidase [Acidobacteriaceae bacterium]